MRAGVGPSSAPTFRPRRQQVKNRYFRWTAYTPRQERQTGSSVQIHSAASFAIPAVGIIRHQACDTQAPSSSRPWDYYLSSVRMARQHEVYARAGREWRTLGLWESKMRMPLPVGVLSLNVLKSGKSLPQTQFARGSSIPPIWIVAPARSKVIH